MSALTPRLIHKFIVISCLVFCSMLSFAQGDADYEEMKAQAYVFYKQGQMPEVLELAKKLNAKNPKDIQVLELYAFSMLSTAQLIKDPAARKQARVRARELAVQAKDLGNDSNLLEVVLSIPPDGGEDNFSKNNDVDKAMREGEAAFAQGNYKKAIAAYELAFQIDPNHYEAALFLGDVYFKQQKVEQAGQWFAKAIAIDPDRETAYRYWGDALMMVEGKKQESRVQFIDAIIADPYNRRAWVGLMQWADKYGVKLAHPAVRIPTSVTKQPDKDGKKQTSINIDFNALGKKDGTSGWMFYGISRSLWMDEKFFKEFPNEKTYRHSLREEMGALKGVIEAAENELKEEKGKAKLDPVISNLINLNKAGLLESFILIAMPDEGIARDYAEYRKTNRDKLRKYLSEVVVNGGQIGK